MRQSWTKIGEELNNQERWDKSLSFFFWKDDDIMVKIINMDRLITKIENIKLYQAGIPYFPRIFSRDGIIATMISRDYQMLRNHLIFSGNKQGSKKDPVTGEEPGKIFHEYPGFIDPENKKSTLFNAIDTTPLFLIGHAVLHQNKLSMIKDQAVKIERALEYIYSHIDQNGYYFESPELAGADHFALKVTYWKDSFLIDKKNGNPEFPVIYTLAHIMAMRGLEMISKILDSKEIHNKYISLSSNLPNLVDSKRDTFFVAIDKLGKISSVTSDNLHALFYLNQDEPSHDILKNITEKSKILATEYGFQTIEPIRAIAEDPSKDSKDNQSYHRGAIWPFEQAVIHNGALKHNFPEIAEISTRCLKMLDSDPEIIVQDEKGNFHKGGCDPQLWTIAAKKYFSSGNYSPLL
jgi:glycogen debranching enzyme